MTGPRSIADVIERDVMPRFKTPRVRSRAYLDWIKTLPCAACGQPADDPHHLKCGPEQPTKAVTASDLYAVPLCARCHRPGFPDNVTECGNERDWWVRHDVVDPVGLCLRYMAAYAAVRMKADEMTVARIIMGTLKARPHARVETTA